MIPHEAVALRTGHRECGKLNRCDKMPTRQIEFGHEEYPTEESSASLVRTVRKLMSRGRDFHSHCGSTLLGPGREGRRSAFNARERVRVVGNELRVILSRRVR